jgi:hypothetical protein
VILLDPPVLTMYGAENTEVAAARG